jgi:hypothetical protein
MLTPVSIFGAVQDAHVGARHDHRVRHAHEQSGLDDARTRAQPARRLLDIGDAIGEMTIDISRV